jgi:uncharacterized membrane protein YdjX (TVP38/TMEM64 family)
MPRSEETVSKDPSAKDPSRAGGAGAGPTALPAAAAAPGWAALKLFVLVLVAAACVALIHFTPLGRHARDIQVLRADLEATGSWAGVCFTALTAGLVACGAPRLLFSALGGLLLGFGQGLFLSLVGSIVGSYATFLFARWSGRDWVRRRFSLGARLGPALENPSVVAVFWLRQLPVTGAVLNVLLGITAVRHRTFLVGSTLGYLPGAAVVTLVGSGLGKESSAASFLQMGLALAATAALAWALFRLRGGRATSSPAGGAATGGRAPPA